MTPVNPFTPSFGETPLVMAGRQETLNTFSRAFEGASRAPELTTLVSGARGTGKTVLLANIAETAQASGWIAVNVTADKDMLEEVIGQSLREARHLMPIEPSKHVTGIGIGQLVNIEWENAASGTATWRGRLEDIVAALNERGVGLLITVDEVLPELDEMKKLASVYQHFIRERRKVALVMAGLPFNINSLLEDRSVSFMRRATRLNIGRIPDYEVEDALAKTFEHSACSIDDDALRLMVDSIEGFPFMLQLAGYRTWEHAGGASPVTLADAEYGCGIAASEMRERVIESSYRELSDGDIAFLTAMLPDEGDTSIKDIEKRMGRSSGYVNTYRRRMLAAGIIGTRRRGWIGFDLPGFKDFLRDREGA